MYHLDQTFTCKDHRTRDIRICYIGDSFVNGIGDEKALGRAGRLCALADDGATRLTYYNLGFWRSISHDVLQRAESEICPRLPQRLDSHVVQSH